MRSVMRAMASVTAIGWLAGCETGGSRTSPWQTGIGVRIAPGFSAGDASRVTLHPTAAYFKPLWGGPEGESNYVLLAGGQLRFGVQPSGPSQGPWLGGEAMYGRRTSTFDDPSEPDESSNGWTLAALAGLPIANGSAGTLHGYVAAGVVKFGGSGPYVRVGVDVQPAFLRGVDTTVET